MTGLLMVPNLAASFYRTMVHKGIQQLAGMDENSIYRNESIHNTSDEKVVVEATVTKWVDYHEIFVVEKQWGTWSFVAYFDGNVYDGSEIDEIIGLEDEVELLI